MAILFVAACGAPRATPAPAADFLLSAGDSTYWVTSDSSGVKLLGVPMVLARVGGRFRELYVADDDRSFPDAIFIGQRLFSRDLVRGDSIALMADTVVPRLAAAYARAHPRVAPLAPDEEANDDPDVNATADLDVLDVHGPYVSIEYHVDVDTRVAEGRSSYHRVRRGVLDARRGASVRLAELFGDAEARRAEADASRTWSDVRDSLSAQASDEARRRLAAVSFDPLSYSLEADERTPQVVFALPRETRGGSATSAPTLTARPMTGSAWWTAIQPELPLGSDSLLHWERGTLTVVARLEGDGARVLLRDAAHHEWSLGVIAAPVQRLLWLDATVDAEARKALQRAFSDAALYSETTRVAAGRVVAHPGVTFATRPLRTTPRAGRAARRVPPAHRAHVGGAPPVRG